MNDVTEKLVFNVNAIMISTDPKMLRRDALPGRRRLVIINLNAQTCCCVFVRHFTYNFEFLCRTRCSLIASQVRSERKKTSNAIEWQNDVYFSIDLINRVVPAFKVALATSPVVDIISLFRFRSMLLVFFFLRSRSFSLAVSIRLYHCFLSYPTNFNVIYDHAMCFFPYLFSHWGLHNQLLATVQMN